MNSLIDQQNSLVLKVKKNLNQTRSTFIGSTLANGRKGCIQTKFGTGPTPRTRAKLSLSKVRFIEGMHNADAASSNGGSALNSARIPLADYLRATLENAEKQ